MVFIVLGSNLGNRLYNLRQAVDLLRQRCLKNVRCSLVLETESILPDIAEGVPLSWNTPYLNMIVSGETHLSPDNLLHSLLTIEKFMGRVRRIKWEPRIIDLDILFYKDLNINSPHLVIPHPEIDNRPFVKHLLSLMKVAPWESRIYEKSFLRSFTLTPNLVGIVNITKDSFSDGGKFYQLDEAIKHIMELSRAGAGVIDIGAQSTRPGATIYSCEDEYNKLVEVLEEIRPLLDNGTLHVSIDTFRASLIKNLVKKYKISWINCVKDECLDDDTLRTIADHGCKLCLMHSLSIPPSKDKVLPLHINPIDFIERWGKNFIERLIKLGFSSENIILDPGIGFGKTPQQNINLLRCIEKLKALGVSILLGHSRKSYMDFFCKKQASQRDVETIALSLLLKDKVDFLRVHDVEGHMRAFVAQHMLVA